MLSGINAWSWIALLLLASTLTGCGRPALDHSAIAERTRQLQAEINFQYPLDNYFPETPVTTWAPPEGELYHAAEDSFAPAGTPVYAIGDGVVSFSGHKRGYGGLIIIDHPEHNVYSLYGHLSLSRWMKEPGPVNKGELIAYLSEPEQAYTKLPHIHFGLRIGQRADYPGWGNRRWMAGYTNGPPSEVGWLHPSVIIGETLAMREWKYLIRKREDIVFGDNPHTDDFKITPTRHNEKENLDAIIVEAFGEQYRLADWRDIKGLGTDLAGWADRIGLVAGEENSVIVSNDGWRIWLGRQYYVSRFEDGRPEEFLAHGSLDGEHFCLGSWNGLKMRVLAVRKIPAPVEAPQGDL